MHVVYGFRLLLVGWLLLSKVTVRALFGDEQGEMSASSVESCTEGVVQPSFVPAHAFLTCYHDHYTTS